MGFVRSCVVFGLIACLTGSAAAQAQENVGRLVVWQPKPGMTRSLEEGYKRHLEWHRRNGDPWTWLGWTLISGERFGWFVDATFHHTWAELDSPIAPAEDAADNQRNVFPYGDIRLAAIYESVTHPMGLSAEDLESPLLTFTYLEIQPGTATQVEARLTEALRASGPGQPKCAILRPASGTGEYLLLVPSTKTSDLAQVSSFLQRMLATVRGEDKLPVVLDYRTETARYRPDLSYRSSR